MQVVDYNEVRRSYEAAEQKIEGFRPAEDFDDEDTCSKRRLVAHTLLGQAVVCLQTGGIVADELSTAEELLRRAVQLLTQETEAGGGTGGHRRGGGGGDRAGGSRRRGSREGGGEGSGGDRGSVSGSDGSGGAAAWTPPKLAGRVSKREDRWARLTLGNVLSAMGTVDMCRGNVALAEQRFHAARALVHRAVGRRHAQGAQIYINLAGCATHNGDSTAALTMLDKAMSTLEACEEDYSMQ